MSSSWLRRTVVTGAALGISVSAAANLSGGWVHRDAGEMAFISLTQTADRLKGYMQVIEKDLSIDEGVNVRHFTFSGVISGLRFTLWASGSEGSGSVGGSTVTLHFPLQTGQTSSVRFRRGTAERWKAVVTSFERSCRLEALNQRWSTVLGSHLRGLGLRSQQVQSQVTSLTATVKKDSQTVKGTQVAYQAALDELLVRQREFQAATTKVRAAAQAVEDARVTYRAIATLDNERALSTLESAEGMAEVAAGHADVAVGVQQTLVIRARTLQETCLEALRRDDWNLQGTKSLSNHIEAELTLSPEGEPFVERLFKGALWSGTALNAGQVLDWPDKAGQPISRFQPGRAFSVVPFGSHWCAVMLQNHALGWVDRLHLSIKRVRD